MSDKKEEKKRYVFRRINGRIIPIAVGAVGAGMAADAARTRTVYKTKNITINRKSFSVLPMELSQGRVELGTGLHAYDKSGKKMGHAYVGVDKIDKEGFFDWLGVKRDYRGKGVSKTLARQSAVEMKQQGAKTIFSHVVHKRSASLLQGKLKSSYWKSTYTNKAGEMTLEQLSKSEALKKINSLKGGKTYYAPNLFRQVTIPKRMRRLHKPFMGTSTKVKLVSGLALLAGSAAYLMKDKK